MAAELDGKRVAILVANSGVERVELTTPRERLDAAGATTTLVAPEQGEVQSFDEDVEKSETFRADRAVADVSADDFDALVLPGGTTNPDKLRMDETAMSFVRSFAEAGKPIAAICHGPWTLATADVLHGKTLTSWPSLQTDLRNAGATWVDERAVTCPERGFTLVTSRNPDDLDAFSAAAIAAFSTS